MFYQLLYLITINYYQPCHSWHTAILPEASPWNPPTQVFRSGDLGRGGHLWEDPPKTDGTMQTIFEMRHQDIVKQK